MAVMTSNARAPRNLREPSYTAVIAGIRLGCPFPAGTPYTRRPMPALPRLPRDRQRGNSLLLALIVLSALATLGSLTVVSVQSSLKTSTNGRSQDIALYAAESGAAVAMDMLRAPGAYDLDTGPNRKGWSQFVVPNDLGVVPLTTAQMASNGALPGTPNNQFSNDLKAWYSVEIHNNRNDPGFGSGAGTNDQDGILIIRSTGHGPQGSLAIVEWEVQRVGDPPPSPPAPPPPIPPPPPAAPDPLPVAQQPPLPSLSPPGLVLLGWHIVL